jgi:hypothetical protein
MLTIDVLMGRYWVAPPLAKKARSHGAGSLSGLASGLFALVADGAVRLFEHNSWTAKRGSSQMQIRGAHIETSSCRLTHSHSPHRAPTGPINGPNRFVTAKICG